MNARNNVGDHFLEMGSSTDGNRRRVGRIHCEFLRARVDDFFDIRFVAVVIRAVWMVLRGFVRV